MKGTRVLPTVGQVRALEKSFQLRADEFEVVSTQLLQVQEKFRQELMERDGGPSEETRAEYLEAVQDLGTFYLSVGVQMSNFPYTGDTE